MSIVYLISAIVNCFCNYHYKSTNGSSKAAEGGLENQGLRP